MRSYLPSRPATVISGRAVSAADVATRDKVRRVAVAPSDIPANAGHASPVTDNAVAATAKLRTDVRMIRSPVRRETLLSAPFDDLSPQTRFRFMLVPKKSTYAFCDAKFGVQSKLINFDGLRWL
ncbi:MAG: hypothetical protein IKE66_16450 [Hyphomicrobium sp.]|nr:hypothetical protein [Hyphomicrobium sp.]